METREVVIVGGGVAGCGSAYYLAEAGAKDVLLLEGGRLGRGDTHSVVSDPQEVYVSQLSGTAVPNAPARSKMMVTVFPSTAEHFVEMHGVAGGKKYFQLARTGIHLQKHLIKSVLKRQDLLRECESWCCASISATELANNELLVFKNLGVENARPVVTPEMQNMHGPAAEFTTGIAFSEDGICNSETFASDIARFHNKYVTVRENARVASIVDCKEQDTHAVVVLESGEQIRAKQVVVATGGLFVPPELIGYIRPCWSYVLSILAVGHPDTPNFFTPTFTHDWCFEDGWLRLSGEDHYSALERPCVRERIDRLHEWAVRQYPFLKNKPAFEHYGVYSETPDLLPIIGKFKEESKVCYLQGCNAWGQATMSFGAFLIPKLLGYGVFTPEELDLASFVSPVRSTLHKF